jgi:hypothetical protein
VAREGPVCPVGPGTDEAMWGETMDPNATLRGFWDALDDRDLEAARHLRDILRDWTVRGGFLPSGWFSAAALLTYLDHEIRLCGWATV